ncbi:uncharacterized protein LOC128214914 isoform X2 [Mya arenaria]|nr:uncharacterized protein LOC128214914 isoform X2 [Mya arenaria]
MAAYGDETLDSTVPVDAVGGRILQHCKPCYKDKKTTPASVYCKNCKEFQCLECSSHHKRYDFMSDHSIVDRQQAETEEHVNMFGYDNCLVHGISVEIYCKDHDLLICAKCAFSNHKKCENAKHIDEFPVEKTIEEFKHRLTACCDKAEEFISNVNEIGIKEKDEAKAKADKMKSDFCDKMDKSLAEFLIEIDSAAKSAKSSMLPQVSGVSNIHDELNMWVNSLNNASKQGLSDKCYILSKSLETKLKENEEFLKHQYSDNMSIHTEHTFVFKWNGIQQNTDVAVQANGSDFLHLEDDNPKAMDTKTVSMNRKTTYSSSNAYFSGIDFLKDGRLVAVDNRNKKCLILCENLQVLGKPFTFFTQPLDVCAYNDHQIAVTTGAQVYFLKVDRLNNIMLTRKVSTSAAYFAISRFNCSMFLCSIFENTKVPVRVVDFEGKETDFIDTLCPIAEFQIGDSFTTYAELLGIIILTDFKSNKVYMFNTHTGEKIIVDDKRIQGPRQVCMAPDDTVFVCCDINSSICRFTLDGQVLQAFTVPRNSFSAIRISQDGTKLVISRGSEPEPSIQLYELTYTLNK